MTTTTDYFLSQQIKILQLAKGFRAGLDTVLLASAVDAKPHQHLLDIGCGVGVALACLAARVPEAKITGVELQPEYAALAEENLKPFEAKIIQADIYARKNVYGQFHHVLMNPPYHLAEKNMPKKESSRALADHLSQADMPKWMSAAKKNLRAKGYLTMIIPTAVLPLWLALLANDFGDIRILPLWPRAGVPSKRTIIRARYRSMGPAALLNGIVLHNTDGSYTMPVQNVLRGGALKLDDKPDDK